MKVQLLITVLRVVLDQSDGVQSDLGMSYVALLVVPEIGRTTQAPQ